MQLKDNPKDLHEAILSAQDELKALHKAILGGYNGPQGTDIDLADQSIIEHQATSHPLTVEISQAMANANVYEQKIIKINDTLDLEITKVDSGVYDVQVTVSDPNAGNYGDKLLIMQKTTVEALVQGLKTMELIGDGIFGSAAIQPDSLVSAPVMPKNPNTPIIEAPVNQLADLQAALRGFKGDLHIHMAKATDLQSLIELNDLLNKNKV